MKKRKKQRASETCTSAEFPGIMEVFPDIPTPKKAILFIVHFENDSRAILQTFFEILSHSLDNEPFKRASMIIFRHDETKDRLDRTFFAVTLVPPKTVKRMEMIYRCVAAWDECGAGELADFVRIESKTHLVSQLEEKLDELREDDCSLFLAGLSI